MTPIKSFRPKWADRCLYRRRPLFRKCAWAVAILAAAILLWFSFQRHQLYHEAAQRVSAAENERDLLLAVLKGERTVITEDGEEVARVKWEKVKLVEGVGK